MSAAKNRCPATQQLKPSFPGYDVDISINQRHTGDEVVQQNGDLRNCGVVCDKEGIQHSGQITVCVCYQNYPFYVC